MKYIAFAYHNSFYCFNSEKWTTGNTARVESDQHSSITYTAVFLLQIDPEIITVVSAN